MCLAQGQQRSDAGEVRSNKVRSNKVRSNKVEPAASRSRVKHSTTEPLHSLLLNALYFI